MAENEIEIFQEWCKGTTIQIQLHKERELHIEKNVKKKQSKFYIDLLALKDESKSKIILGWKWFVTGVVALVAMWICLEFVPGLSGSALYMSLIYVAGLGSSAGCFYMAWKSTSRMQIFHSRNADVPIFEIAINLPSKKEFNAFVDRIEHSVRTAQENRKLSMKKQLAGEMRMLRRLAEEGVLSNSIYKQARDSLLSMH